MKKIGTLLLAMCLALITVGHVPCIGCMLYTVDLYRSDER